MIILNLEIVEGRIQFISIWSALLLLSVNIKNGDFKILNDAFYLSVLETRSKFLVHEINYF